MLAPACARCTRRHLDTLPCWGGRYVAELRTMVLTTYGDTCCHCSGPGARSVEHVQPRSHGGTDDLDNLRPAHLSCNLERGTRPMQGYGAPTITAVETRW
jgi:5-methylcytosine-specific restriction endonuclease McrA